MSNKRHRNNCSASRLNSPSKRLSGGLTVLERSLTTRCISKKDRDKASLGKAVGKEMNKTTQHVPRSQDIKEGKAWGTWAQWGPGPAPAGPR